ncbi:MAG: aminodeoxychorismate synthase component I [Phycisphaerae bacterium]|jgi:para-aminobenzoate synthetase component 1|nr:aminodeoxychorismate synthase component I [Phycisphaerae bacterium]MDP7288151.1 aminodeoxychorismate synthase component I [Phycisphaerae bacterium]
MLHENENPDSPEPGHWTGQVYKAKLQTTAVDLPCPPGALLDALDEQDDPVMLDSSALHETYGRYSIVACCPSEVLSLRDGVLTDARGATLARDDNEAIWAAMSRAFGAVAAEPDPGAGPYAPGWIGYVGYEVGRRVERLPAQARRDTALPDMRMAFYDSILLYDALNSKWSLVSLEFDRPARLARSSRDALLAIAARSVSRQAERPKPTERADAGSKPTDAAQANFTPQEYLKAVSTCTDYIAAGDIFQVNLSQRFTVHDAPAPRAIYRALRNRNPAWYSAYMTFESDGGPCAVLSSSPELFLRVRRRHVTTRPIKGTRRRTSDTLANSRAASDLIASPKDNAELAMIIDLLRNDLGRVCRFGSVRVTDPRALETHPTVFHLVGTVEGDLRPEVGPAELLRATFPGGSITGAPKIRAMEIIDQLEPVARGPYTGCVGIIGADGSCEWNIVIRTIVCDADKAHVQVGGGIVADSTPQGEYQETLDKARAMLEAIAVARVETRAQSAKHPETKT